MNDDYNTGYAHGQHDEFQGLRSRLEELEKKLAKVLAWAETRQYDQVAGLYERLGIKK